MYDYFPHVWLLSCITYLYFHLFKMYPHVKDGYKILFFLNFWMFLPESLDDEGQEIRKQLLILMPIFIVLSILIGKAWN